MKHVFTIVAVVLTGVLSFAQESAKRIDEKSTLSKVVVYPDRAQLTRDVEFTAKAGTYDVVFKELPAGVVENSVRAKVFGSSSAKLLGIDVKRTFIEKPKDERISKLQDDIQKLSDADKVFTDELTVLASKKEFLDYIRTRSSERIQEDIKKVAVEKPNVEDFEKTLNFVGGNLAKIIDRQREIELKRRELARQIDVLNRELGSIRGEGRLEYKTVIVTVESPSEVNLKVEMSYILYGASWYPVYDARAVVEKKEVEITYYGIVRQTTGEKWENVELVLTTANPSLGARLPELTARYLSLYAPPTTTGSYADNKPQTSQRYQKQKESASLVGKEEDRDEEERKKDLAQGVVQTAVAEERLTSVFFKVKKRETVASDNTPRKVTVAVLHFPAEFEYDATPSFSPHGYLKTSITNGETPLLAGEMNVFLDADFVGTSYIKTVAATQKFDAYLGVDEGVRIERKEEKRFDENVGGLFSSSKKRLMLGYRITAHNYKKVPIKITINDRIPVSQSEDIKVELVTKNPEPTEMGKEVPGVLKWRIELKPGEKKEFYFEYNVTYPADKNMYGLK
ncbi:MAG: hypothetical protein A2W23_10350 [Planctomycetes bacterium RBG_16_43_13]|nr:MAG: hypothetical protein A2W23_10350 [Planctomycetes bacterium RBG_16_43_13]